MLIGFGTIIFTIHFGGPPLFLGGNTHILHHGFPQTKWPFFQRSQATALSKPCPSPSDPMGANGRWNQPEFRRFQWVKNIESWGFISFIHSSHGNWTYFQYLFVVSGFENDGWLFEKFPSQLSEKFHGNIIIDGKASDKSLFVRPFDFFGQSKWSLFPGCWTFSMVSNWFNIAASTKKAGSKLLQKLEASQIVCLYDTLPETNIAPKNGWLEYYFPIIGEAYFHGLC